MTTPLPEGAVELQADDLAALLLTDNPEASLGGMQLDADLIDLVRAGAIRACRLPSGRLAFTRTEDGAR